jgi:hypothetical protein
MPESEYRDGVTLLTGEACLQLKAIDGTGRRSGCFFGKTIKHFCVAHAFLTGTIAAHAPGKPIRYITGWRESGTIVIRGSRHQEGKAPPPGLHIKSGMTDWALACTQYRARCKARRISFGV